MAALVVIPVVAIGAVYLITIASIEISRKAKKRRARKRAKKAGLYKEYEAYLVATENGQTVMCNGVALIPEQRIAKIKPL